MSGVDIFDDIRRHAGAAGGKFMHENVVLAAVEEILTQQSLDRSAVSYMGALMLSLQSGAGADPAVYAGVLKLLERALGHVPRGLLLAKAGRIAQVIVAVANTQIEQPAVLTPVESKLAPGFSQLALRRLLSAPTRAFGCPERQLRLSR
mgnify:FL=1|jgi:hypothetical protein